jgi:hypothetical protein
MRTLMKVTIPVEAGNKGLQDGSLLKVMQGTLERLRPEAAYFYPERGKRTALFFIDVNDPSAIPPICEPLFQSLNADVELTPVMNAQDLQAGISKLPRT